MRVEKIGEEYCLRLTQQMVDALQLSDGVEVEVQPVNGEVRSIGIDEAVASYLRTEPRYVETYRELAR